METVLNGVDRNKRTDADYYDAMLQGMVGKLVSTIDTDDKQMAMRFVGQGMVNRYNATPTTPVGDLIDGNPLATVTGQVEFRNFASELIR